LGSPPLTNASTLTSNASTPWMVAEVTAANIFHRR
jgi:hypothetical protein